MNTPLDRRLNAYRSDLADVRLKDRVEAERFVSGEPARITAPVADCKSAPERAAGTDTQFLMGERVSIFERVAGWCWVQAETDGYVGYVEETQCSTEALWPTHRIVVPRTFRYPDAELKAPPLAALSAGSRVAVTGEAETRGTRYFRLEGGGAVIAGHCLPIAERLDDDFVTIAAGYLGTPYLWGGRSGFGLDCSGFVQLCLSLAGISAPRDTDMQASGLGEALDASAGRPALRRGDLVFWTGHVGFMEDAETLLHASGYSMTVTREPLDAAVSRIAPLHGSPTAYRRI